MSSDQNVSNRLISAVSGGHLETARELINSFRLSFSKTSSDGYALLLDAAMMNHTAITKLLLKNGSPCNSNHFKPDDTPLHFAALHCNIDIVKILLNKGANVNAKNKDGKTPLFNVINNADYGNEQDKLEVAELLLKHKADVNASDNSGASPLHIASQQGCEEIVKLLLNRGADVNASTKNTLTPLHSAVKRRDIAIINLLLKHGARVDYNDKNGKTILQYAVEDGCLTIVESILKYCSNINKQCKRSSLKTAVYGYKREKIIQALLEYGFRVQPDDVNAEYFHSAIREGYLKIVKDLLKYGANVQMLYNATSEEGFTPLHSATKWKQYVIAKLLISLKANVNARDKYGKTPIAYAIQNWDLKMIKLLLSNKANIKDNPNLLSKAVWDECIEIVEVLLQYGADINCSDEYGRTPLHFTALTEYEWDSLKKLGNDSYNSESLDTRGKMAELLLSKGANVNARTKNGITTLCAAIKKGCAKVIEALLKYNADLNSVVISDVLPLHLAVEIGNEELIILLLNKGADVNAKGKGGITSLHVAAEECRNEVVKILLEYGAYVNSVCDDDMTPLYLAAKKGNEKVVETLLKFGADINYGNIPWRRTALRFASEYRHEKVVETLLEYGADIDGGFFFICNSSSEVFTAFECQIIKIKKANLYVSKENLQSIRRNDRTKNFEDECEKEIEKMKSEKINNTKISFYDILARNPRSLAKNMRNENVVQILQAGDYKSKFPIYATQRKIPCVKSINDS